MRILTPMMLTRHDIIDALARELPAHDVLRGAWLGGSDATGRADELSDVDLFLVIAPGQVEPAAGAVDSIIRAIAPVRLRYRLPWPTWHGYHQAFYQLDGAPEHLMVDWLMIEAGQSHPWLEVERHGTPRVLFDKDGHIRITHVDRASLDAAIEKKVSDLREKFRLLRHLPPKLIERDLPGDAMHFYFSLIVRPLVDLLRCLHCPERHDFGFRYIRSDLPRESWELIERLCYVGDPSELPGRVELGVRMFEEALGRWDARARRG
ncbi:MAG: hypothetical protein AB7K52_02745 [Phycisphaerales bacterium]